jgi:hypothetical protein
MRRYKALEVPCPECNAAPGKPCVDRWAYLPLRGVHRARGLAYNERQMIDPELWEARR